MKTNDPFSRGILSAGELYRQTRNPLDEAIRNSVGPADNLKRLMDQLDGPLNTIRQLQRDPYRDLVDTMLARNREKDRLIHTMQAIEEAQSQREQFVRMMAGTDLLRTRDQALTAFDASVLRTGELFKRNSDTIASAIAATRPVNEMADLASSIVRGMDALRLTGLHAPAFPKSAVDIFVEQYSQARKLAEELEQANSDEQRVALMTRLIAIVANALKGLSPDGRDAAIAVSIILSVIALAADIKSLLPAEAPPGMLPSQVQMLEETNSGVDRMIQEWSAYRTAEHSLDEAAVADLPRAETSRPVMIRAEPSRNGKALFKAPAGTILSIRSTQGRWKQVYYRDPLTDQLARAWVYGPAVRLLD